MDKLNYTDCIDLIDNLEQIEQVIIRTPKYRRCCYNILEICKGVLSYLKLKKKIICNNL